MKKLVVFLLALTLSFTNFLQADDYKACSCISLALLYANKNLSIYNPQKTTEYLEKRAEFYSDPNLYALLYLMYKEPFLVQKDEEKAKELFEKFIDIKYLNLQKTFPKKSKEELKTEAKASFYHLILSLFADNTNWEHNIVPSQKADSPLLQKYLKILFDIDVKEGILAVESYIKKRQGYSFAEENKPLRKQVEVVKNFDILEYAKLRNSLGFESKQERLKFIQDCIENDNLFLYDFPSLYLALYYGLDGFPKDQAKANEYLEKASRPNAIFDDYSSFPKIVESKTSWDKIKCLNWHIVASWELNDRLDPKNRIDFITHVQKLYPNDDVLQRASEFFLARTYIEKLDYQKALESFEKYIKLGGKKWSFIYSRKGLNSPQYAKLLEKYSETIEEAPLLLELAYFYETGVLTPKDDTKIKAILDKVVKSDKSVFRKETHHPKHKFYINSKWADEAYHSALIKMMFAYMGYGEFAQFVEKNDKKVFEIAKKLENCGEASLYLAMFYDRGIAPFEKNPEKYKIFRHKYQANLDPFESYPKESFDKKISSLNFFGDEFFEKNSLEFTLDFCKKVKDFNYAETQKLYYIIRNSKTPRPLAKEAKDILITRVENEDQETCSDLNNALIAEAISNKNYEKALKLLKTKDEFRNNTPLVKIAFEQDPKYAKFAEEASKEVVKYLRLQGINYFRSIVQDILYFKDDIPEFFKNLERFSQQHQIEIDYQMINYFLKEYDTYTPKNIPKIKLSDYYKSADFLEE